MLKSTQRDAEQRSDSPDKRESESLDRRLGGLRSEIENILTQLHSTVMAGSTGTGALLALLLSDGGGTLVLGLFQDPEQPGLLKEPCLAVLDATHRLEPRSFVSLRSIREDRDMAALVDLGREGRFKHPETGAAFTLQPGELTQLIRLHFQVPEAANSGGGPAAGSAALSKRRRIA